MNYRFGLTLVFLCIAGNLGAINLIIPVIEGLEEEHEHMAAFAIKVQEFVTKASIKSPDQMLALLQTIHEIFGVMHFACIHQVYPKYWQESWITHTKASRDPFWNEYSDKFCKIAWQETEKASLCSYLAYAYNAITNALSSAKCRTASKYDCRLQSSSNIICQTRDNNEFDSSWIKAKIDGSKRSSQIAWQFCFEAWNERKCNNPKNSWQTFYSFLRELRQAEFIGDISYRAAKSEVFRVLLNFADKKLSFGYDRFIKKASSLHENPFNNSSSWMKFRNDHFDSLPKEQRVFLSPWLNILTLLSYEKEWQHWIGRLDENSTLSLLPIEIIIRIIDFSIGC